jgi:hypothetical protein
VFREKFIFIMRIVSLKLIRVDELDEQAKRIRIVRRINELIAAAERLGVRTQRGQWWLPG